MDAIRQTQGFALGRAFDAGLIPEYMLDAGARYGVACARYARAKGLPRGFPAEAAWGRLMARKVDPNDTSWLKGSSALPMDEAERVRIASAERDGARAAVRAAEHYCLIEVERVVLDDEDVVNRLGLYMGLSRLAEFYGLARKSP